MNINKDYYKILNLNKDSSIDEIKKSYKKFAILYHPDKTNGDKDKEEKFKNVSEAYSILGDKDKKQQYDTQSKFGNSYNPNPFSAFGGVGDIWSSFFGSEANPFEQYFGGNYQYKEYQENLDININIIVTLRDVYKGTPIKVSYKRYVQCDDCNGTGFDKNGKFDTCEVCNGTGRNQNHVCEYCQGKGKIFSETCKSCNGEKVILKDIEFNLSNIFQIRKSRTELMKGYGHQSKYFPNKKGNLTLNIIYQEINNYFIENGKLIHNLDIHYQDAINGFKYEYETLDDKKLKIHIPKKTSDGDKIKIKNKGLLLNPNVRDDLIFKINIIIDYSRI